MHAETSPIQANVSFESNRATRARRIFCKSLILATAMYPSPKDFPYLIKKITDLEQEALLQLSKNTKGFTPSHLMTRNSGSSSPFKLKKWPKGLLSHPSAPQILFFCEQKSRCAVRSIIHTLSIDRWVTCFCFCLPLEGGLT